MKHDQHIQHHAMRDSNSCVYRRTKRDAMWQALGVASSILMAALIGAMLAWRG